MKRLREFVAQLWSLPSSNVANVLVLVGMLLSFLGLLGTAVLAFYSYKLWNTTNDTLQEIRKQTPAVIQGGQAAQDSATLAKQEAASSDDSAKKVLEQMRSQSTADQTLANSTKMLAANSMQEVQLAERPVLSLPNVTMPNPSINSFGGLSYTVETHLDNDSRNPATNVAIIPEFVLEGGNFSPLGEINHTCHAMDKVGPLAGVMVPPDAKDFTVDRTVFGGSPTRLQRHWTQSAGYS